MNKKSIYHWIPNSNLGGCEILLQTFLQGQENHRHIIFTSKEGPAISLWQEHDVEIIYLPNWNRHNPMLWAYELKRYLIKFNPGYFISWSTSRLPFLRWTLKDIKNLRYIVHVGNKITISGVRLFEWTFVDFLLGLKKKDSRLMVIGCSKYVEISIKQDRYFRHFNSIGILNGVRECFFKEYKRKQHPNNISLGTVGRLDAMKRQDEMIMRIKKMTERGYFTMFYIIGNGNEEYNLKKLVSTLKLESNVVFRGQQFDIIEELKKIDIFLFNSTEHEGMGIALAEAMSMGLVCIVNDSPLMREMLGDIGIFFSDTEDFMKKIENVLNDQEKMFEISTKVRQRAKKLFAPNVFFKNYMKYLELN